MRKVIANSIGHNIFLESLDLVGITCVTWKIIQYEPLNALNIFKNIYMVLCNHGMDSSYIHDFLDASTRWSHVCFLYTQ
jgi:hypothetical protein